MASWTEKALRGTLKLPSTPFPMRANAAVRELAAVQRLTSDLYKRQWDGRVRGADVNRASSAPAAVPRLDGTRNGEGKPAGVFVLHDGPPYANGSLHMGHAMNKVLKDIANRYQLLRGKGVAYVPGWDCHGLPIEIKALEKLYAQQAAVAASGLSEKDMAEEPAGRQEGQSGGSEGSGAGTGKGKPDAKANAREQKVTASQVVAATQNVSPLDVRATARACALEAIEEQRGDFIRWGVMADWMDDKQGVYRTMDPEYEAAQLEVFATMLKDGRIFRGEKPVYWSPSSRTALAEAELEYTDDHTSTSVFVSFGVSGSCDPKSPVKVANPALLSTLRRMGVRGLIWTTTPWTLPSNVALCVHPELEYSVVQFESKDLSSAFHPLLLASDLIGAVSSAHGGIESYEVLLTCKGEDLRGMEFQHPLHDRTSVVLTASHVTNDSGTGIVHTAPGHGVEDFQACRENGIATVLNFVDDAGKFIEGAGEGLTGLSVLSEGNSAVVSMLTEAGVLFASSAYKHRYPYDWRTKQPVIVRATHQWFASVEGLVKPAISHLKNTRMVPAVSTNRLAGMLQGRREWCISRQRSWGVPIPVFYHKETGEVLATEESVQHVVGLVAMHGTDCWWNLSEADLLPPSHRSEAHLWQKGTDTLDVWFDSGTSWKSAWAGKPFGGPDGVVSDVVLEGSDQHRGWFQSSLLTSVAATGEAPYRTIITHGFTLDESLRKMSKSLGNIIAPKDVIDGSQAAAAAAKKQASQVGGAAGKAKAAKGKNKKGSKAPNFPPYGADVLRYWVGSTDYTTDVVVGPTVMSSVSDGLRKVRNTARFLLSNLEPVHHMSPAASDAAFGPDMDTCSRIWSAPVSEDLLSGVDLAPLDKYMLSRLAAFQEDVENAYSTFNYSKVVHSISQLVSGEMSPQYLDKCKDRLYADPPSGRRRELCQAVLFECLRRLTLALAPLAPFTADDVYQHSFHHLVRPGEAKHDYLAAPLSSSTVFDVSWPEVPSSWKDPEVARQWAEVLDLQSRVNAVLEYARSEQVIGSSLDAAVEITLPADHPAAEGIRAIEAASELDDVMLTSAVHVRWGHPEPSAVLASSLLDLGHGLNLVKKHLESTEISADDSMEFAFTAVGPAGSSCPDPISITVTRSPASKCARCWKRNAQSCEGHGGVIPTLPLCARCVSVLDALE